MSLVFVGPSPINLDAHSQDIEMVNALFDLMDFEANGEITDEILVSYKLSLKINSEILTSALALTYALTILRKIV